MLTQSKKQLSSRISACPFIGSIHVEFNSLFSFLVLKFYYGFEALVFIILFLSYQPVSLGFVQLSVSVFKQTALLPELRWKRRGRPLWALVFLRWNSSFLISSTWLSAQPFGRTGQTLKQRAQEAFPAPEEEPLQKFLFLIIFLLNFFDSLC